MTGFKTLFSPITIRGRTIRNRIFFPGHHTNLTGASPSPEIVAYYEARARGGAGLVVVELASVYEPGGVYSSALLMTTSDDCIDGYGRIAERCHAHDCKAVAQLFHPGREIRQSPDGGMALAFAPSAVPTERFRVTPAPFTKPMIRELVSGFGDAAVRLERAGLDGIEVIVGFGFVLSQFLSPRTNRRDDEYGGCLEDRLRIMEEIFADIRNKTDDMIVGIRISVDERSEEGLGPDDVLTACEAMEQTGEVDYFCFTDGGASTVGGAAYMVPSMSLDHSELHDHVRRLRTRLATPFLMSGRINQPQLAEDLLKAGLVDMCGMTRPLIADPEFPNKARDGRSDAIRACVACNQSCIGRVHKGATVSCIQNPESGRELAFGETSSVARRRKVLVIGGGPAGMKAASTAAARGHAVTLWEASRRLGGQILLAQQLPGRAEFGGIVTNLVHELDRRGVEIQLGAEADANRIRGEEADVVIVATGAKARRADLTEEEGSHVVDAWSVVEGSASVGARVVVYDWLSDWTGLGVAEKLARDGCAVTLAVNGYLAGEQLPVYTRDPWIGALHRLGVAIVPYARLHGADSETVYLQHTASGEPILIEGVDTLVTSMGGVSNGALRNALAEDEREVHFIGDCLAPRSCEEAILEGQTVGAAI